MIDLTLKGLGQNMTLGQGQNMTLGQGHVMIEIGHVACQAMRLDETSTINPSSTFYLFLIKIY